MQVEAIHCQNRVGEERFSLIPNILWLPCFGPNTVIKWSCWCPKNMYGTLNQGLTFFKYCQHFSALREGVNKNVICDHDHTSSDPPLFFENCDWLRLFFLAFFSDESGIQVRHETYFCIFLVQPVFPSREIYAFQNSKNSQYKSSIWWIPECI